MVCGLKQAALILFSRDASPDICVAHEAGSFLLYCTRKTLLFLMTVQLPTCIF